MHNYGQSAKEMNLHQYHDIDKSGLFRCIHLAVCSPINHVAEKT